MTPIEMRVKCPYCGEKFTAVIDPSEEHQDYIEDCYVCCRPIRFTVSCANGEVSSIQTSRE